jgi:pyruvate/2-oxoacid:ferredoxin oxidoreductase beta subunit
MTDSVPTSDPSATPTLDVATSVSDTSSFGATPGEAAPVTPEGTVTVSDTSGMPADLGSVPQPAPDATHVYISLTFNNIEKDLAQQLIDTARSVVGRDRSFSVTFGSAIGDE